MDEKQRKSLNLIKVICFVLLIIVLAWGSLVLIEFNRVKNDKKPIFCFNELKDIEDDDEYSKTCYGILYKYREYYLKEENVMSAKEFTLVFKDFERNLEN